MAIAHDTTETTPGAAFTSVSSGSITNWDGGSGSNRFIIAQLSNSKGSGVALGTGVTYSGAALTQVTGSTTFSTFGANSMWGKTAPATGNNTLAFTYAAAQDEISFGAAVFTGVDQTTPYDTAETNSGTGTSVTNNYGASASGDVVVDSVYSFSGGGGGVTFTVGASQTLIFENESIGGGWGGGTMSYEAGAASVDMTHTIGGDASQTWHSMAISLNPASGASVNTYMFQTTLGVG